MLFVQAAHVSAGSNLPPTRIVIHGTVSPCQPGNAQAVAAYFQSASSGGSAHYVVDPSEIVQCVREDAIAWHAPPNPHSLGVELSDPQAGDPTRWADPAHEAMLALAAGLVRDLAGRYGIPLVKLGPAELLAGASGICGHADVSAAWHQTDHTDPGPDFPWPHFLALIAGATTPTAGDDMPFTEADIIRLVTEAIRSEGVSGAGDTAHMLDAGYRVGMVQSVTESLRSEGVSGAGDTAHNGAAAILARLDPASIAAAVPAGVAQAVADELAKRLTA